MATYVIDVDTGTTYLAAKGKKAKKAIKNAGLSKALLCAKNARELRDQLTAQELVDCYVETIGEQPPTAGNIKELAEELADALALEKLEAFDPAKHCQDAPAKSSKKKAPAKKTSLAAGRQRAPRPIDGIPFAEIQESTFERGDGANAIRGPMRALGEHLHEHEIMDYSEIVDFVEGDEEAAIKLLRNCFAKDIIRQV